MPESNKKPSAITRSKSQALDIESLQALITATALANAETTANVAELSKNITELKETSAGDTIIMSESDQKTPATMHSKTKKAFDNKALQALITANAVAIAKHTKNISEIKETSEELNSKLVLEQEVYPNDDLQAKLPPESSTHISGNSSRIFPSFFHFLWRNP
jgi:hypothetical protein